MKYVGVSLVFVSSCPGPIFQEKFRQLAVKLGNESFHASNGWLTSWQREYMVSFRASGNREKV